MADESSLGADAQEQIERIRSKRRPYTLAAHIGLWGFAVAIVIELLVRSPNVGTMVATIAPLVYYTAWIILVPLSVAAIFGILILLKKPVPPIARPVIWTSFWASAIIFGYVVLN